MAKPTPNRLSLRITATGPGGEKLLTEVALAFRDAIARALRLQIESERPGRDEVGGEEERER